MLPIAACAQQAKPPSEGIRSIEFERISHSRAQLTLHYKLSSPTRFAIEYGEKPSLGFRTPDVRAVPGQSTIRISIGGLAPDREYYFQPVVVRKGVAFKAWRCPEAKSFEDYECDDLAAAPRFRTAADPGDRPVLPHPPLEPNLPMPSINGERFSVQVDANRRCTNLQQTLDQAAAADPELNHEVLIPAGATCVGAFEPPAKSGSGTVVVRTDTPLDRLPPEGSRISPSYAPLMATLSPPPNLSGWLDAIVGATNCTQSRDKCTQGWRFVGIRFAPLPLEEFRPDVYGVSDVVADNRGALVTLDRDIEFGNATIVGVSGLVGAPGLNRVHRPFVLSKRQLLLRDVNTPESYQPGTGHVVNALFVPIAECSGGHPIVCRTETPHGLEDPPTVTIARKEGHRIVAGGGRMRGVRGGHVMRIHESSLSSLNGVWSVSRSAADWAELRGTDNTDCSQNCGSATAASLIQIQGTGRIDGSHLYTVLSDTEFQLDYLDGKGQPISGGFVTQDPQYRRSLIAFGPGNERLVLDRCIVDGGGFPFRYQRAMSLGAADSAVLDSHFEDFNSWRALNPASGQADGSVAGFNLGHSQAIELSEAKRITIANNTFLNCVGITIFAQEFRKSPEMRPSDVAISRNTFRITDEYRAGSPDSNGRYYPMRHVWELKRGVRFRFDGNRIDGGWADFTPTGPAIGLFPVGTVAGNEVSDIDIRNNTFRRISSGIQITTEHKAAGAGALPTARVRIHNNLFDNIDFYAMRSRPSGVNGLQPSSNFGGYFLILNGSMEDLTVTHNTVYDNRGRGPWTFKFAGGRSGGVVVTDNIFTHNVDNTFGGLAPPAQVGDIHPLVIISPFKSFTNYFTQTPAPDPYSSFARNLILPGVRDSSSPENYESASQRANFTRQDCESYYHGFEGVTCVSGRTAADRFRSVFPVKGDFRFQDASVGSPGADIDKLEAAQGFVSKVEERHDANGATTLSYRVASGDSCVVDFASDGAFQEFIRAPDSGSGAERYVVLKGLEPGGAYHYRVQCPSGEQHDTLVVPGTPKRPAR